MLRIACAGAVDKYFGILSGVGPYHSSPYITASPL